MSVTAEPCSCGNLASAAADRACPIAFDPELNEYHVTSFDPDTGTRGHWVVYHCLFCGGAAPESKRDTFFTEVSDAETERLERLTSRLRTVDEAIAKLGPPDEDHPNGMTIRSNTAPQRSYRLLRYTRLSEHANVTFVDYGPERGLRMRIERKYVGAPKPS